MKQKQLIKVRFSKVWDKEGTVYKKGFVISKSILDRFVGLLKTEHEKCTDHYREMYLKTPLTKEGNKVFMNLTQSDFFYQSICKSEDIECNLKRAANNNNSYLIVID